MKKRWDSKGLEMNFAFIFSLIVGAVILFLAIYVAVQFVNFSQFKGNTKTAKQLTILFEPLGTSLEEGKLALVDLKENTRIYNECKNAGDFGKQEISISTESRIGERWPKPGVPSSIYDKYLFSDSIEEGKRIYFFTKPFDMPFKVGDLIFLYTETYCFTGEVPYDIEYEISRLKITGEKNNFILEENIRRCDDESIVVCFNMNSRGCDIIVQGDEEKGTVEKNGETVRYIGNLIYGAIFSDIEIYECNVERLTKRLSSLSSVYADKTALVLKQGCESELRGDFEVLADLDNLQSIKQQADRINIKNDAAICQIY